MVAYTKLIDLVQSISWLLLDLVHSNSWSLVDMVTVIFKIAC